MHSALSIKILKNSFFKVPDTRLSEDTVLPFEFSALKGSKSSISGTILHYHCNDVK